MHRGSVPHGSTNEAQTRREAAEQSCAQRQCTRGQAATIRGVLNERILLWLPMDAGQGFEMPTEQFFAEARENSVIKAAIIAKYFTAWAKIVGAHSDRVAYFDLFAGPGRYGDDTKSTPLLVLEQAIKDPMLRDKLVSLFNDQEVTNASSLREEIGKLPGIETLRHAPIVDNESVGDHTADALQKIQLVPTLCFFDPFGYKGLSLRLINAVLKDWACECVFFFNYNRINMGLTNSKVRSHMEALFGDGMDRLQVELNGLAANDRELRVLEELTAALKRLRGKYVLPFRFRNAKGNRTSHHLIFVSKHPLGYSIMKGVMAASSSKREQGVPSFEYSVADERFPTLFELSRPLDALEGMLTREFAGQRLTMQDVYDRHNVGRPFIEGNYKEALRNLEERGAIVATPPANARPKRNGVVTFAAKTQVFFPARR